MIKYNRLKILLAEKEILNKDLAELLGVNPNTVSRWANNRQQPDVPMLFKIAIAINTEIENLLISRSEAEKILVKTSNKK